MDLTGLEPSRTLTASRITLPRRPSLARVDLHAHGEDVDASCFALPAER